MTQATDPTTRANKWQNAVSGAFAGVVSRLVIAPLDVVKIRFQIQTTTKQARINYPSHIPKYRGILQSMLLITKEEGLRALWKGNWPAEYLYLTYGALQFLIYHETSQYLAEQTVFPNMSTTTQTFISGALAGCSATFATYPLDLLRTRFAMQGSAEKRLYTSLIGAIGEIGRTEGVQGFYRGVWPSLLQIAPYMGIMFGTQDWLTRKMEKSQKMYWPHGWNQFVAGGLAGIVSKTAVMPFDVVRKRLQVQGPSRKSYVLSGIPRYSGGFFSCARQIVVEEGFVALYKGLWVSLVKTVPSSAITFWVVSECRRAFEQYNRIA
ncbi:putative mitochondrial deoxynucleotide carrier protein, partial [Obelidium mucronatum]